MPQTSKELTQARIDEVKRVFAAYLDAKKQRKTPERFAIIEEIYSRNDHFDVDMLYIQMKNKNYRVSRATVYNTLDLLVECELVIKHPIGKNREALYEKALGFRQHDHLICIECGKIFEFCDPRVAQTQALVGEMLNFEVKSHSLLLYGSCRNPECAKNKIE